jgi:hypothetical protein
LWLQAHVEQVLFPALAPGVNVIMDNRSSQKNATVRMAIEEVGATLL